MDALDKLGDPRRAIRTNGGARNLHCETDG
jgi:hypothetical protein